MPREVRVSRVVSVPPSVAYRVLSDYRSHHGHILPRPEFVSLDVEEGGVGAGTRIRVVMRVMGRSSTIRMRVEEPEPGRVLREVDEGTGVATTFTVMPVSDGKECRVEIATTWPERRGLKPWLDAVIGASVVRPLYARELDNLDAYARTLPS